MFSISAHYSQDCPVTFIKDCPVTFIDGPDFSGCFPQINMEFVRVNDFQEMSVRCSNEEIVMFV